MFKKFFSFLYLLPLVFFTNSAHATENIPVENYCLSIDGGGLRGIFPATVLKSIDFLIRVRGQRIFEIFPAGITGTSTGALIALGLTARKSTDRTKPEFNEPLLTTQNLVDFYEDHASGIFSGCTPSNCCLNVCHMPNGCCSRVSEIMWKFFTCCGAFACFKNCCGLFGPKYSNEYLRKQLQNVFREEIRIHEPDGTFRTDYRDRTLSDVLVPVQIISFDINRGPVSFNTYDHPNVTMYDAALASSAAPTFFQPHVFGSRHYIDGGICENNPSISAYDFAIRVKEKKITDALRGMSDIDAARFLASSATRQDFYILSIGTGRTTSVNGLSHFARYGIIGWAPRVIDFSISGTALRSDEHIRRILKVTGTGKGDSLRIQIQFNGNENIRDDMEDMGDMDDPSVLDPLRKRAVRPDIEARVLQFVTQLLKDQDAALAVAPPTTTQAAAAAGSH